MDRLFKQFIFGLIYVLIFGSIGYGIKRWVTIEPTCFDNIKNQTEEGVDCGVVCGKLCDPEILPLSVEFTQLLNAGVDTYDVISRISNPNRVHGSGNITYNLVFKDRDGTRLGGRDLQYKSFILPGQRRYVVHAGLKISGNPSGAELVLRDARWVKLNISDAPKIDFVLRREQYTDRQAQGAVYEGVLLNDSDFDFGKVDISIIFLDGKGTPVAVNQTDVRTLLSHEERYFKVEWLGSVPNTDARIVEATTNAFLNENYIRRYGSQEKFQQYR